MKVKHTKQSSFFHGPVIWQLKKETQVRNFWINICDLFIATIFQVQVVHTIVTNPI